MRWLPLLAVLLLVGCAADIRLRNPQTGQRATCEGGCWAQGLAGILDGSPKRLQIRCLDDYEQQGYQRVPK